jgi:tetratricopeptide (TPR) repeat protein
LTLKGKSGPVPAWRLVSVLPGAPERSRRLDAPLIGRSRELSQLRATFDEVEGMGGCRLVTVIGSPGVGKTRLVRELLGELGGRATVLRGRCLSYGDGITFWPIIDVLRQAAELGDHDTPADVRRKLAELVADEADSETIADLLGAVFGFESSAASIEETFWAVRRTLELVAATGALIVLVEDLHWAEPTLLDLVEQIVEHSGAHLLLVATSRPELLEMRPDWEAEPRTSTIRLEPLDQDDAGRLVDALLGEADLPSDLSARIAEAGGGNPLFVEEMLSMLIDDGALVRTGRGWIATVDLADRDVPPTVLAVISARLDRLAPAERVVAERASIVGEEFARAQVSALVSAEESSALSGSLATLEHKEFIAERNAVDEYRFRHILIRDQAYAGMTKLLRAELHERFAEWLVAWAGERSGEYEEIIGFHLEAAYRYLLEMRPEGTRERTLAERAGAHLARAGRSAHGRNDAGAAVKLLERAAGLLAPEDRVRLEALVDLAEALMFAGELARAGEAASEAMRRAEALGDEGLRARARNALWLVEMGASPQVKGSEIREMAESLVDTLERLGDDRGLAMAWRLLAYTHWLTGDLVAMESAVDAAVQHSARAGMASAVSGALQYRVQALSFGPTPVLEALQRCEEILADDRLGPRVGGGALVAKAHLLAMVGRFDEARSACDEAADRFRQMGMDLEVAGSSHFRASVELLAGLPVVAERELRAGAEVLEAMGGPNYLSTSEAMLAEALAAQGRFEEAEGASRRSESLSGPDDLAAHVVWRTARARAYAGMGRADEAIALAREAVAMIERTDWLADHADAVLRLADVLHAAGNDEALERAEEALRLYERKGNSVAAATARGLIELIRA